MKGFLIRLSYYLLMFGVAFLVAGPIVGPLFASIFAKLYTGHWKDWDWILDQAIWGVSKGLILTPLLAFATTFFEYGIYRGWWKG